MTPASIMSAFRRLHPTPYHAAWCMVIDGLLHLSATQAVAVLEEGLRHSFGPDAAKAILEELEGKGSG